MTTSKSNETSRILARARMVLEAEARAIDELIARLDGAFEEAVEMIVGCGGRVVTSGMGKSGIICKKIASTLSSTGTPALFLHPAEAIHGDLGMLAAGDVLIVVSNSGETEEVVRLLPLVKRLGLPMIAVVGNLQSTLARESDLVLDASIRKEACPLGLAPTASTTAALAMGDALAMALVERRNFSVEQFAERHPGGDLGKRFLRVGQMMHTGEAVPRVDVATSVGEAVSEMSTKGFGMTSVVDEDGRLVGIVTDGDLRRLLGRRGGTALEATVGEAMTPNPQTIDADEMAAAALEIMDRRHITSLLIVDDAGRPVGVLHLHDLWRTQLF